MILADSGLVDDIYVLQLRPSFGPFGLSSFCAPLVGSEQNQSTCCAAYVDLLDGERQASLEISRILEKHHHHIEKGK